MFFALGGAAAAVAAVATRYGLWRRRLGVPPPGLPPVLAYHQVGTPELGGTWCTRGQFAAHLEALQRAGYRGIDTATFARRLAEVMEKPGAEMLAKPGAEAMAKPRAAVPAPREVLLTFDDAYTSFAAHALPELLSRRFPVLLFVITAFVGKRAQWDLPLPGRRQGHLDWAALRALVSAGVEIGSHASTHRDLRRLQGPELQQELEGSRRCLEDALGVEVRSLSYPFGRCDARIVAAAAAAGYHLGFSMCPSGPNARVQPLALRRFGVYSIDSPRAVLDKVDPGRALFWWQDLLTRGINASAALAARAG